MKEILITYILSYVLIIISGFIYNILGYNDVNFFINNIAIYISLIYHVLTIIYLYNKNKRKERNLLLKNYFLLISLGISIAIIYNMIVFKFIPPIKNNTISLPILIILSSIVGPIFEEILFRYIFYNRLKNKYSIKKSTIINSLIFAIIHINPIKIIYAFILGIILNTLYEKYKTIKAPITIHISGNIIVLFLNEYNPIILILSLINLVIYIYIIKNDK